MRCLAKDRRERPHDVLVVMALFEALSVEHPWTQREAEAWWRQRRKGSEQDVLNTEDAYRRTQQQNDELKRQLEAARKALAAAKAREAAARQAYEKEVDAVDRLQRKMPIK